MTRGVSERYVREVDGIRLPRNVVVGHGVRDEVLDVIDDLHLQGRPLFVTSPTPREVADPIAADFEAAGIEPAIVTIQKATFAAVERVIEVAEAEEVTYLVGIGGGRPSISRNWPATTSIWASSLSADGGQPRRDRQQSRLPCRTGIPCHSVAAEPPLAVVADTGILAEAPWS